MPIFSCSAILFDLDGVLLDSTGSVDRQWRAWAERKGVDPEKVMAIAHGVRAIEVVQRVAPQLDAEAEVRELEEGEAQDREGVFAMPGAAELVRTIPEGRWGVVTSGSRHLASTRLPWGGLPVPKVLVTADDVANGKPDPEPYLKGAHSLGFKPAECVAIEDAPAGIRSAHAAGMKVIGMASTYGAQELVEADAVVEGFRQISLQTRDGKLRLKIES